MKRFALHAMVLLLLLAGTPPVRAMTVIARDFDQLVSRAETIFKGTVAAKASLWIGEGENRHIVTRVTFQVEETYKGDVSAVQILEFAGGTVGIETLSIDGVPTFEVGQGAVLFVVGNGNQFCPLVGIHQGRFHIVKDDSGAERIFTDDLVPVVDTADLGQFDAVGVPRVQRSALTGARGLAVADFKTQILSKVAARGY